MDPANRTVQQHLGNSGRAYVAAGNAIEERVGSNRIRIAEVDAIPATMDGTAEFQIYNVLAAVAASRAYGLSPQDIERALMSFSMEREGRGRLNVFSFGTGYVVVDYGHNPVALKSMQDMIARWNITRRTAVITLPGDRRDDLVAESARTVAQGYDRIFIREDKDLRGRQPGEMAELLARLINEERPDVPTKIILDELEATIAAVSEMEPGEVVVTSSDRKDEVIAWLRQAGAEPLSDLRQLTRPAAAIAAAV
jgi:cyanophycin synthetase